MRFSTALALGLVAAFASGCTIHVVEHPASAQTWSQPEPAPVVVMQPTPARPVATPATPSVAEPRRVASSTRPSAYGPVTAAPGTKPNPVARPEPRPTRPVVSKPVVSKPVVSKPTPSKPVADKPVTDKPKGRYPFRTTRPEPRRPELASDEQNRRDERRLPPVLLTR